MFRAFSFVLAATAITVPGSGGEPRAFKGLRLRTAESIRNELLDLNRLLLGNETSGEFEYDEVELDRNLMAQMRGVTVRVFVRNVFPYIILDKSEDGEESLSGYVGEMWNKLEQHLGFRTKLIAGLKDGKEWDILLNPRELRLELLERYGYTFPITKIWYHLFAKGKPRGGNSVVYCHIFDSELWMVIMAVSLVLSFCLWVTWKVRRKALEFGRYKVPSEQACDMNYSTCILSVLGCMINQGSQFKSEKSSSIRIITLLCILLGLIITTSFSALLISKLATVSEVEGENLDLESLVENPRGRTLCVAVAGYAYRRLVIDHQHYTAESKLKLNEFPCTPGAHDFVPAQDYCAEDAVVLETVFNAEHTLNPLPTKDSCVIYIYYKEYFNAHLVLVVRKGFPYLRIINKYLLRMEESGLTKRLKDRWQPTMMSSERDAEHDRQSRKKLKVSLHHVKPIIFLYLGAVAFSLLILVLEKLYKWLYNH